MHYHCEELFQKSNGAAPLLGLGKSIYCNDISTVSYTHLTLPTNREV